MKNFVINNLKELKRYLLSLYVIPRSMEHLQLIRAEELNLVIQECNTRSTILEIGAGAGWQSKILKEQGYSVSAIDITDTNYKKEQVFEVIDYDGHKIPFEDKTFDIVFSSNVLEHIPHIVDFQKEIKRVLKDDGICIHLLPTSNWVFWSNITGFLRSFKFEKAHGAIAKRSLYEIYYFSKYYWDNLFNSSHFRIVKYEANNLFYTGGI